MTAVIKSYSALVTEINERVTAAVENVSKMVCIKLAEIIDTQYYNDPGFYPNINQSIEQFLKSVAYEMLDSSSCAIGVKSQSMHYKNGFSGEKVSKLVSQSMQGYEYYETWTQSFWNSFIEWCDKNVANLLRKELAEQGLTIK